MAAAAGTLPDATPASAADSARTEKAPIGTLGNVTVPAAVVKPVSVVASGPGTDPSGDACALTVTAALATTLVPDAARTVTVRLPTPRSLTIASAHLSGGLDLRDAVAAVVRVRQ